MKSMRAKEVLRRYAAGERDFPYLNLRGQSFQGQNLAGADFSESDIREANFSNCNLNYSNLTRADLRGADLTYASLTGACLEAWSIDSTTRLEEVYCSFVYLLEQPKKGTDDRERLPSTGVFEPGEFSKLFQKALDSIDLIMPQGVGLANYQALKVLEEEYQGKLRLKEKEIKIDRHALAVLEDFIREKEKFCQELKEDYELSIKAIEDKYLAQLTSKNEQIEMYRDELARLREFTEKITQLPNIIESNQNEMKIQEIKEKYEDKIKAQDELINEYKERVNNLQKINDKNYELSLEAIERKYLAQLKGKDKEIEIYRDELAKLREIAEKMAQLPIVIQSNSNQISNNT